ncbi:MAG: glucokinase [Alphaproteobacteria bacterium]|nr:glucokinase [Alphaproteobacteria bacterium]MCW5742397.1 glucokinase [Alphaproteobacteria bacterium]
MTGIAGSILCGDIGGTNARLALLADGAMGAVATLAVADHPDLASAIRAFLGKHPDVDGALLAVAGPVTDGRCVLTNSGWVVDAAELKPALRAEWVSVVNDFEAQAWALPTLGASDLVSLGGGPIRPDQPMAMIGPGTGLGMACLMPNGTVIVSEGGHATLAAGDDREAAALAWLRRGFDHVSAERVLSGDGMENLHAALAAIDGVAHTHRESVVITAAALDGSCARSAETVDRFCAILGSVAGDLALLFGARGGVFVTGGIAPAILPALARSAFRARFEAKGRFRDWLAPIATSVVTRPNAAFAGIAARLASGRRD